MTATQTAPFLSGLFLKSAVYEFGIGNVDDWTHGSLGCRSPVQGFGMSRSAGNGENEVLR